MNASAIRPLAIPAIIVVSLLLPATSFATDTEEMWLLGFGLNWTDIGSVSEDDNTAAADPNAIFIDDTGIGGSIIAGYGFGPALAGRLELSTTEHDTSDPDVQFFYSSVVGEMLYIFRELETWRPYVLGGLGWFSIKSTADALEYEITGSGLSLGGGFYYFFTDNFTLDASVRGDFISWSDAKATLKFGDGSSVSAGVPIDESGSAARISAGASWWF